MTPVRRILLYVVLLAIAVAVMMFSLGCTTVPKDPATPPRAIAAEAGCPDPALLDIPQGINSAQLEAAIYGAYLELIGLYIACQQVSR